MIDGGKGKDKSNGGQGQDAIYGGAGDDLAVGGQGNDNLFGGSQRDRLRGSGGNDLIVGNADQDTLTGGGGNDTFSFITIKDGIDTITDFFTGSDVIDISKIVAAAKLSLTPFQQDFESYIILTQIGADTKVSLDLDGGDIGAAIDLVVLKGIAAGQVTSQQFYIG